MESFTYRARLRMVKFINIAIMTAAALICWLHSFAQLPDVGASALVSVIFLALYMTYGRIYDSFLISLVRITEMVYSQALALVMSDGIFYLVVCLMDRRLVSMVPILVMLVVQLVLSTLWCVCAHKWYFAKIGRAHV